MKIAISTHDYPKYISGPNVWLERITSFFQEKNVDTVVLFTNGELDSDYRYITSLKNKGIPIHVYQGRNYTDQKIRWILQILQHEKPDIFIPNFDIPSLFASKWVREAGIPTIGAMRSDDEKYMAMLELFVSANEGFTLNAMVCVSEYLEHKAKAHAHDTIIRRIPSGTPVPVRKAENSRDKLRLIYAGRIEEKQKRISETASVLCETVKRIAGTEVILYGAGDAIDSVKKIIKQRGEGLPIRYGGILNSEAVQNELLNSQVFVLLSDYEGLPTALMEAMACGLVPICLKIDSGVPELIEHNKNGLLVHDRGEDFIEAVRRLKTEEGLWEKLSIKARNKIEKEYSVQYSFQRWLELFEELLGNEPGEKGDIKIPSTLNLPAIHPSLKYGNRRWPGYLVHYLRQIRRFASQSKAKVLNF